MRLEERIDVWKARYEETVIQEQEVIRELTGFLNRNSEKWHKRYTYTAEGRGPSLVIYFYLDEQLLQGFGVYPNSLDTSLEYTRLFRSVVGEDLKHLFNSSMLEYFYESLY